MIFVAGVSQKYSFISGDGVSNAVVLVNADTGVEFHLPIETGDLEELMQFAGSEGVQYDEDEAKELVGSPAPDGVEEEAGDPVSYENEEDPQAF